MKGAHALGLLGLACAGLGLGCGRSDQVSTLPVTETLLELDLSEPLPEQGTKFLGEEQPGMAEAVVHVRALLDQPLARGLFVRLGPFEGRLADVDEWASTFDAYRQQKRPVHCHFDSLDNAGYALASHCDRVTMTPAGMLELVGLAAQIVHGRALLEMVGVQADLMQVGKYKGAAEPFTRDSMSPELRESLDGLLDDLESRFAAHLATRTERSKSTLAQVLAEGPFTSSAAKRAGLIDAICYDDEARAKAKAAASARAVKMLFERREHDQVSLREVLEALSGDQGREREDRPHLGLVFLTGEIIDAEGETVDRVGGGAFVSALRRFADDKNVRAVVLRIESPGGSALASDRMWHAVRRVAKRKPVIVSIGDMAASGGYYVAAAGTRILAEPSSIVGSIGVVGGKMVVAGLADKLGVKVDTLRRSERATWLTPFEPFRDDERKAFENMLRDTYDRFLERIAIGRALRVKDLVPAAEGRVMGGERAKQLGLVDEIGGLTEALVLAREQGKLPKDAPVRVWPNAETPLRALSAIVRGVGGAEANGTTLEHTLGSASPLAHSLTQGALISVLVRQREPMALTLPFALLVR